MLDIKLFRENPELIIDSEKKRFRDTENVEKVIEYDTLIIKSGGDMKKFFGKFYDDKENEIKDIVPHWTIVCDFSDKLQIDEFDNCLSIGIDDDSYIDEEFKLICSDGNNDSGILSDALIIKVDSLL